MIRLTTIALMGLSIAAAGAAYAQDSGATPKSTMSSGQMMSGKSDMSKSKMSDEDTKTMKMCQGMSHDAMMKEKKCIDLMKVHPDMMKSK
jgi:hypothetical protein